MTEVSAGGNLHAGKNRALFAQIGINRAADTVY